MKISKILCFILLTTLFINISFLNVNAEKASDDNLGTSIRVVENEKEVLMENTKVENTEEAKVTVKEGDVIKDSGINNMFGFCWDWGPNATDVVMESASSTQISKGFINAAKSINVKGGVSRAAGSSSSNFRYLDNIGPIASRKSVSMPAQVVLEEKHPRKPNYIPWENPMTTRKEAFGTVEWLMASQILSPGCQYIPVLNMVTGTPEDSANLAEFLTYEPGQSTGKTDWAALRVKYGVKEPIEVAMYELGNELAWDPYVNLDSYIKSAKQHISAVKAVDPNAKFIVCLDMTPATYRPEDDIDTLRVWNKKVVKELGDLVDYASWHPYFCGTSISTFIRFFEYFEQDCMEIIGRKLPLVFTETAKWPIQTSPTLSSDPKALIGALSLAQFYNVMLTKDYAWGATYYSTAYITNSPWNLIEDRDGNIIATGVGQLLGLYSNSIGEKIINSTVTGSEKTDVTSNKNTFTVIASTSNKRDMTLILVNREPCTEFNLSFDFENNYELVEETVFTAPNINSYIMSAKSKDIFKTVTTEKSEKNFNTFTMPTKSMVVLKLRSDKDIVQYNVGEDKEGGEEALAITSNVFSDMDGHWASPYVTKLFENGIINGITDTEFGPEQTVTRGELAKMIAKAYGLDTNKYSTQIFNDVAVDDTYFPYIEAVYFKAWMRGDNNNNFGADKNVTMEELAVISARVGGYDLYGNNLNILNSFKYKSEISDWAEQGVAAASINGLISGLIENDSFNPQTEAKRSQAALAIYRLVKDKKVN